MQAPDSWRSRKRRLQAPESAHSPSFVSQLNHIERDLDAAQQLCAMHQFEAARRKLLPHLAKLAEPIAGAVYLILGQCAMHGAGHNWPALLHKARAAYHSAGDAVGAAHTRLWQGIGYFARGELSQAQTQLTAARQSFTKRRVAWGEATVCGVQAKVFLAQHDLDGAMQAVDTAVGIWTYLNEASEEAGARQVRAQLLASAGRTQDAARDLLWAEKLVGADASHDVRTTLTLGRADSLLWMGFARRAAAALSRIAGHADNHPNSCTRAHFHRVMGQALMVDAPVVAAQHLHTAVDLLQKLGESYSLAQAHIYLACCEHRLGLPTAPRLQSARLLGTNQWPVVRDALTNVERHLQTPPGRLTGPQPVKSFDPDAVDVPTTTAACRPVAYAHGSIDPQVEASKAPTAKSWRHWTAWVRQALGDMKPYRLWGRVTPEKTPERALSYAAASEQDDAPPAPQKQRASKHPAQPSSLRQRAQSQQRAEVTQV